MKGKPPNSDSESLGPEYPVGVIPTDLLPNGFPPPSGSSGQPDNPLVALNPAELAVFVGYLQADLNYKPGSVGVYYVDIVEPCRDAPFYCRFFSAPEDAYTSQDRAVAAIGEAHAYWETLARAMLSPDFNFVAYESFNLLPVCIYPQGLRGFVKQAKSDDPNGFYVMMLNSVGDMGFSGSPGQNIFRIPFYDASGNRQSYQYEDLSIDQNVPAAMRDLRLDMIATHANEVTDIVKHCLNLGKFTKDEAEFLEAMENKELELTPFDIARYFYSDRNYSSGGRAQQNLPKAFIFSLVEKVEVLVNQTVYERGIENSTTYIALSRYRDLLEEVYARAIAYSSQAQQADHQ